MDSYSPKVDKKHRSKADQNDSKDYITEKENKNKKHDEIENTANQPTIGEINAWELDVRIKMADKQRKYDTINKRTNIE